MSYDEYEGRRTISIPLVVAGLAVVAAIGISLFAVASVREQKLQVELLRTDVRELEGRLEEFRLSDEKLAGRLKTSEGKLREKDQGIAPLAARVLKSVFTVKTSDGLGAGFAGWTAGGQLYVVTAAHVVDSVGEKVLLERNTGSWHAEVVERDRGRDLAVLRVEGKPIGAKPLWQAPRSEQAASGRRAAAHRQPVRARRHGHERRRQPGRAEGDPDRRGGEPRQLGRAGGRSQGPRRRRPRRRRRREHQLRRADHTALRFAA